MVRTTSAPLARGGAQPVVSTQCRARAALPTYASFSGYRLFSFQTDDGQRYETDLVVVTAQCTYVIEMKSWGDDIIEGTRGTSSPSHPGAGALRQGRFLGGRDDLRTRSDTPATLNALRKVFARPGFGLAARKAARTSSHGSRAR